MNIIIQSQYGMNNMKEILEKIYIGNNLPDVGVYCGIYNIENLGGY